ncbi:MAG TPA: transglycosylase domain-containing protein, partial [Thermoleophilaceae bacterium]
RHKPKLKKLRLLLVLAGLAVLAIISTLFGMLISVASDLPSLENKAEYRAAQNSKLFFDDPDDPACKDLGDACELARLTGNQNRVLLDENQISPFIKNAVIAIEDRRFYEHTGVDYKGIARAMVQDVINKRAAQGASTITQQFVKNALSAQGNRSVLQKLREAALAYHLERQWPKQKILTQYLNTVYFGSGAYGVESAMRTYFGNGDSDQVDPVTGAIVEDQSSQAAAQTASPAQAALLAGMIASPTLYDPIQNPGRAMQRRNIVLQRMLEQQMISPSEYREAVRTPVPTPDEVTPPRPDSEQPYFSSWVTQQLVDKYHPGPVFGGGLKIRTTIDPSLQAAAEQAISGRIGGIGPSSSLVAIENKTGEIKAMVGGTDFDERPFNLAVNGHRQPGSSIKPFILIRALADGISPDATFTSEPKIFPVPGSKHEKFVVNNYEDSYAGVRTLASALATSDNSVFAELGLKVGTKRVARIAKRMGVSTPVSTNPAMTLGGLKEGVTPIEMAYAYSTIANRGRRVSGTLAPHDDGPVAIESVKGGGIDDKNKPVFHRAFPESVGETALSLMGSVVSSGTGKAAAVGDEFIFGKTGTTENYGDAWFVGGNKDLTVAVWVGYADRLQPMQTEYLGGPVAGGTFPAEIFHDFMSSWLSIRDRREAARGSDDEGNGEAAPTQSYTPVPSTPSQGQTAPATPEQPDEQQSKGPRDQAPREEATPAPTPQQPQQPTPTPQTPATPAPTPTPTPPSGGTGGGVDAPG